MCVQYYTLTSSYATSLVSLPTDNWYPFTACQHLRALLLTANLWKPAAHDTLLLCGLSLIALLTIFVNKVIIDINRAVKSMTTA